MLSLKNLCLLKVSSLKLPYEEEDVPKTVGNELKKMFLFNGSFFGQDEYVYNDNNLVERQGVKELVLTIQYQGDGIWAIGLCHKCETCSGRTCDGTGHWEHEKPGKVQFELKENETSESEAVFTTVRGLSGRAAGWIDFLRWKNRDKQQVSTVLSVQAGNVPGSGQLVLSTKAVFETGEVISSKLWVDSTVESSPVFKCSVGLKWSFTDLMRTREIPLLLTEGPVTAMEAFRDSITECGYIDRDGDLTDDEEEESDGDLTDEEEESDRDLTDDEESD
eukprot:GFUD01026811.1.p2 GENE.GFUD01026811.1~~GFUD01026811.1.p2  ORF type:complete len:277 (+),score=89.37 GFUD01026811.1:52-882(+)